MTKRRVKDRELADAFRKLFAEYCVLASATPMTRKAQEFKSFLEGFNSAYSVATASEAMEAYRNRQEFEPFLQGYGEALNRWRIAEEGTAEDFNLLDVMELTWKEIRHSMILAWLLDKDMTSFGTHAQGGLGFELFLKEVGLPSKYALGDYRVQREQTSDESRVDIEVAARADFVIHIENKLGAGEGDDQTNREWRDLLKRAESLGCREYYAFYITPKGTMPSNPNFRPISWRQIASVFTSFAAEAKPKDVSTFAAHYAKVLAHITPEADEKENEDAC